MKMYAVVSSERCSLGKGGHKYLDIVVTVGSAKAPVKALYVTVRLGKKSNEFEIITFDRQGQAVNTQNIQT